MLHYLCPYVLRTSIKVLVGALIAFSGFLSFQASFCTTFNTTEFSFECVLLWSVYLNFEMCAYEFCDRLLFLLLKVIFSENLVLFHKIYLDLINTPFFLQHSNTFLDLINTPFFLQHCNTFLDLINTPFFLQHCNTFLDLISTPFFLQHSNAFLDLINTPFFLQHSNTFLDLINTPFFLQHSNTFLDLINTPFFL